MEVVRLDHGGVPCALPVAQALSASSAPTAEAPAVWLWPDRGEGRETPRYLYVETAQGPRSLPCNGPRTTAIPDGSVAELPPLLRAILGMPWVVGIAQMDDDLLWMLDAGSMMHDRETP